MSRARLGRAPAVQPSSNPVWATLESLAVDYLALPPAPPEPAVDPDRERLRKRMLHSLMGTWVQMVANDVVDRVTEVATDLATDLVSDMAALDGAAHAAAPAAAPPHRLLRRDSALEVILRAEAKTLQRRHSNDGLAQAFGGITNLVANAQQDLVLARVLRYGKRQQSLLSGLLSQWDPVRGSLYTFISRMASSFLIDMARAHFGSAQARPDQAVHASKINAADAPVKPGQPPPRRRARRGKAKADGAQDEGADSPAKAQDATPREWVMAGAKAADGDAHGADWLEAQMPHGEDSPEALLQDKQEAQHAADMQAALYQAVKALPEKLRMLFEIELQKHHADLSDDEVIKRMGWGSRNTLIKHRERMAQALRQHLGAADAT